MNQLEMYESVTEYLPCYNKIDAEVVNNTKCENCGKPLIYKGFRKGVSYRAFSICPNCDIVDEF